MHCKVCGKAIGTDRGICPFCGAMLTNEQMKIYKQEKKDSLNKVELFTQKYGNQQTIHYEKSGDIENKWIGVLVVLGVLLIILIITLIVVLHS